MPEIPIGGITAGTTFSETRIVQSASDLSGAANVTAVVETFFSVIER